MIAQNLFEAINGKGLFDIADHRSEGEGPLKVRIELLTSRGKSVQEKEHRVEPGEEWKSFIAFSLAGTDAKFKFFVRCTP